MRIKELVRDIRIHPSFLTEEKLRNHILAELIKQTKDECTEDIGHIVRVLEVRSILDNVIEN